MSRPSKHGGSRRASPEGRAEPRDDEEARLRLGQRVSAERAYFVNVMKLEPEGFAMLLPILTHEDPSKLLGFLEPEVARMVFQLAAMACADILSEGSCQSRVASRGGDADTRK